MTTLRSVLAAALLTAACAACTKKETSSCVCTYNDDTTAPLFKNTESSGDNCINHSNAPIGDTVTINGSVFIKACQLTDK